MRFASLASAALVFLGGMLSSATAQTQQAAPAAPASASAELRGGPNEGYSHADFTPVHIEDWRALRNARPQLRTSDGGTAGTINVRDQASSTASSDVESTQSMRSAGTSSPSVPTSIADLARALKNKSSDNLDIDTIYAFVRDNIAFYPIYGVHKGARGALIDRQGSNFDQAELMVQLLRATGHQASYVLGVIQLTPAQVQSYYNISTAKACAVQNYFASGQIPATLIINAGDTCDSPLRSILVQHLWVRVSVTTQSGTSYKDYDPSLKLYSVKSGIDLKAASGYNAASYLAGARGGATLTATTAKNLNRTTVRNSLTTYTNNLVSYIRANNPAADLDDIIGGKTITPSPRGAALSTSENCCAGPGYPQTSGKLSYQNPNYPETIWTDIPNDMRVLLRITYPGVDQLLLADYFYGKRLTIAPNANLEPMLLADGEVLATGTQLPAGQAETLRVEVVHSAYAQRYADQVFQRGIVSGDINVLTLGLGPATSELTSIFTKQAAIAKEAGVAAAAEPALGANLAGTGAQWQAQLSMSAYLTDRIAKANTQFHHQIGLVSQHGGPYFDIPAVSYTVAQESSDENVRLAVVYSHTLHASAFESAVLEQLTGQASVSTVDLIDQAIAAGETLFSATAANYTTEVQPSLVNCTSQSSAFNALTAGGSRLILPQNCAQVENSWTGFGYLAVSGDASNLSLFAGISGGYNGGFTSVPRDPSDYRDSLFDILPPWLRKWRDMRGDPVDFATGSFHYSHDDLTVGTQGYPYGLGFQSIYNSMGRDTDGPLGRGWTHNLAISARSVTQPLQGLGEDSPIDAATSIVESMIALDLFADPTAPLDKLAIAMMGQRWFADQLNNNAVVMTQGAHGELFVKLPDGTYNPPPQSSGRITRNTDGTFAYSTVNKQSYVFDQAGNITKWSSPSGVEVHYSYNNGQLTLVQNSFGRSLSLAYTGGRLTSVSDGTGRSVSYGYDSNGNLATLTDAASNSTAFQYDMPGRMTKYFLPENPTIAQITNTYDSSDRIKEQIDVDGKLWSYYFAGWRSEQDSPLGNRSIAYYRADGALLARIDGADPIGQLQSNRNGREKSYTYDGLGRIIQQADTQGPTFEFTYDDATCNSTEKRCTHNVKTVRRISRGTPALPDSVRNYTYESLFNRVATSTNARGKVTNFSYDATTGNPASVIAPPPIDGGTLRPQTTFAYSTYSGIAGFPSFTLLTSKSDKIDATNSVTTTFGYNAANAYAPSTTVVDSGGLNLTTTSAYDAVGNLTSIDGPRSDVIDITQFGYDSERRLTTVTDARGKITRTAYNRDGDVVRTAAQLNGQWMAACYIRQPSGKVAQKIGLSLVPDDATCPSSSAPVAVTDLAYDDDGRLLTSSVNRTVAEGGNRTTRFGYIPSGELITTTLGVGTPLQQNSQRIDASNDGRDYELYAPNDSSSPSKYFEYDSHRRKSAAGVGEYWTSVEQYSYDLDDNLTNWTRRDGKVIQYTYDNLGRVTKKTTPVSADTVNYTYDLLGRVLSATGPSNVSYTYDKAGRISSTTSTSGTVNYQYDPAGNRIRVTWPGGTFYVTYDYDVLGRTTAIKENGSTLLASYAYDDLSRRTGITYGNSTSASYGYTNQSRLATLTHDLSGTSADVTRTYAYDQSGAITSLTTSNGAYDWNGYYNVNRPYTNDGIDLYLTSGSKALTYDARANLTGDGTWTFTYDIDNRLKTAAVKNGTSLAYTYDALGRLATRKVGKAAANTYLYDGNQLIGEYSSTGALIRRFVRGPGYDEPLVIYDGTNAATKTWLYSDHQGSVTATANASGTLISALSYGPFGEPNTSSGVALRYTGQQLDPDSGLYYYKARWYSPYLGRFMSPDPSFVSDGMHLYAYVRNDPINFTDPTGNWREAGKIAWDVGKPIAEWIPGIGDALAFYDAFKDPSAASIAAAAVGIIPGVGDAAGKVLRHADEVADLARGGTYVLRNAEGEVVRTGRTNNLARREAEHARDPNLAEFQFEPVHRTDDYAEQRGLEQMLHDQHSPALNKIRPISPSNPKLPTYMNAAQQYQNGGL